MPSVYHQHKHKRITGFVEATRAAKCYKCEHLVAASEIFKGWCVACLSGWSATANPALIDSARVVYEAARAVEPPTLRAYERLKARIAERQPDEWFIPMTLYVGNYTIGQAQANWNYLQALYELEVMTSAHATRLGRDSHDLLHLCGRHAPMQSMSLASFLSRVVNSPEVWRDLSSHMKDYIREFISEQGLTFQALVRPRHRIDRFATQQLHKVRRGYRLDPNRRSRQQIRAKKQAWERTRGGTVQPVPNFWPFAVRQAPAEHEMLIAIDTVTRGLPEQWRQDVCQDLVVAVLSGETTIDNLRDALPAHIRNVYKQHPIKYGAVSLSAPLGSDDDRTLGEMLAAGEYVPDHHNYDDRFAVKESEAGDTVLWHEGHNRPLGIATVGDILLERNKGVLVEGFRPHMNQEPCDEDIAEVFAAEQRPRGYRSLRRK